MRGIAFWAVVLVLLVVGAMPGRADPITYHLVTDAGQEAGLVLTGTITLPDSALGQTAWAIDAPGTTFSLTAVSYATPGAGWHSASGDGANGTVTFQVGAIGDAVLIPANPGPPDGRWSFRNTETADGVPHWLNLYAGRAGSQAGVTGARWVIDDDDGGLVDLAFSGIGADTSWRLVLAIPEPATLALFGLGVGVLALRRRRREPA